MKPRSTTRRASKALRGGVLRAISACAPVFVAALAPGCSAEKQPIVADDGAGSTLRLVATIAMPTVAGRIDHMAYDAERDRLFVAALENGTVELIEVGSKTALEPWTFPGEPTGAAWVGPLRRAAIGDAQRGQVWLLDAHDRGDLAGEPALGVAVGADADNVRWLQERNCLLAGRGSGGLTLVGIDPPAVTGEIALGGHPESFQADAAQARAWVNVPDLDAVFVVDLDKRRILRKIALASAHRNYPMALAEADRRVLVGCRQPARMLVFDMETDAVTAELPLSEDVDDIFVDGARGLVYAACGGGFVDVFERTGPGSWKPKEKVATRTGARTCLFHAASKRLFVAVPRRGEEPAEVRVYSTGG